ncbi:MAG: NADH-quinone oxidoreductase subunit A [Armatimonadota bacterium]
MLIQYIPFIILFIIAAGFAGVSILLSRLLGPKHPSADKLEPYESGMVPIGTTKSRFQIRFYLVAMFFILFDIEIVFLYPWAVIFLTAGAAKVFLFFEMLVFLGVLVIGYIYIWKKGALDLCIGE